MKNTDLRKELEAIEREQFFLNMKDNWKPIDFNRNRELEARARKLKEQLGER